jgi:hypothetical protein
MKAADVTSDRPPLLTTINLTIVLAWVLGIGSWIWFNHLGSHHRFDFVQDYFAARNLRIGHSIYENPQALFPEELEGLVGGAVVNNHPPTSAIWYLPFSWLSYGLAFKVWSILNTVLYVVVLVKLLRSFDLSRKVEHLVLSSGLVWTPWTAQLMMGQNSAFQLFLIFLGWRCVGKASHFRAGVLFGLATTLKLFPGLLILYFVIRGRWGGVLGMVFAILIWCVVSSFLGVRPEEWILYQREIVPQQMARWVSTPPNQSIMGLISALSIGGADGANLRLAITWVISALLLGVVVQSVVRNKEPADSSRDLTVLLLAALLLSPICWSHYLLTLLPGLAWIWRRVLPLGRRSPQFLIVMAGTILISWPNLERSTTAPIFALQEKLPCLGLLLLLGAVIFERWLGSVGHARDSQNGEFASSMS